MKIKDSIKFLTALALATLAIQRQSLAGSHTWSGFSSVFFNNPANWSLGGAPAAGEQNVVLNFPPNATRFTPSNNIAGLTVSVINIWGDNYTISGNPITIAGGAQTNITDSGMANGFWAPLVLASNVTVNVSAGLTLYLNGAISGTGGLTKTGAGTLQFNGTDSNTYTGTTYVNGGTFIMARGSGLDASVPGALVVGTPIGSQGTVIAKLAGNNQIANGSPVTVNFTGVLDANNNTDWIAGLVLAGGKVQTGTGKFALNGDVNVQVGSSTIDGKLALYNATNCTFNAVPGGSLRINAAITAFNDSIGIVKTGAGSVSFYGANTFGGPVTVKQGYLDLANNQALGHSTGLNVTNIGIVQLFGVNITNISAILSGNGNGNGALRAFGTNVWNGLITLAGNTGIQPLAGADLLTVDGWIKGTGNLTKLGAGTLVLAGSSANTYQGRTTVSGGTLQLSKSNAVAIPGSLIVGDPINAVNSRVVRLTAANQIADQADVTIDASGMFDFNGFTLASDTIGSLSGSGNVFLGFNAIAVGANNADCTFSGALFGFGASSFTKEGTGTMFLNGANASFAGKSSVSGGTLSVNGSLASGGVTVYSGATLSGDGNAGPVTAFSGKVAPGNSPGLLDVANVTLGSSAVLELELAGNTAGVDYDQINVTGTMSLGNATLSVQLEFAGGVSNKFLVIKNDGNDPISGTFNGLPEGATFYANGSQFQITYHGGDGNDVELTQIALPQPSQISGITKLDNGKIQLLGSGNVGMVYGIEANDDLNTSNWVNIGIAQANQFGEVSFIDPDAPNHAMRFYRLKAK